MNNNPTIRCWTSPLAIVTLVALSGPGGRAYALEVRSWLGRVALRVVISSQAAGQRLGRAIARADRLPVTLAGQLVEA